MLIIAAALGGESAAAQSIEGRVLDASDRSPLPEASVVVRDTRLGVAAGSQGHFRLPMPAPGTYVLVVSHVGYRTESRTVVLEDAQTAQVEVALTPTLLSGEEVIVLGERNRLTADARSVATLDAAALSRTRGQTLGETIAQLPGVTTLRTGPSIAKPVIRGLHSQRIVVLNHGVPQEGQQWGGEHAPEIDPFAPAEIEVIRGAASVEYGAGAIGGVVRLQPEPLPTVPGLDGQFMLNAFSNNWQGAGSLLLEGGVPGAPGWGWRAQGSVRRAGDARTPRDVIGNSAFEELDGALTLGYRADRWGLEVHASHFGTELGIFKGAHIGNTDDLLRAIERGRPLQAYDFTYGIDRPKQTIAHDLVTLKGRYRLPGDELLEVQYGLQRNRRQEFDAHRPYGDAQDALDEPAFELTLVTHTFDARVQHRLLSDVFGGGLTGALGASVMTQGNVNGQAGYLIPNFRATGGGLFVHETWLRGAWTLEAGARADLRWMRAYPRAFGQRGDFVTRTETYGSLSGLLGVIWQFADRWSLAARTGTGWRAPSVNELYSFGVHHGTAQFERGDPDLGPERSLDGALTLRHDGPRTALEVSVFSNRIGDYIFLFPEPEPRLTIRGAFPSFQYAQADAVLRGFDGQASVDVTRWWQLGAGVSVVRGTNRETDEPLVDMPADRLNLQGTLRLPGWTRVRDAALTADAQLVRTQTRYPEGVLFAPPPDGYAVFGLSVQATVQAGTLPLQLGLSVRNLFDTTYRDYLSRFRYFVDEPGRDVVLRLTVPLGS